MGRVDGPGRAALTSALPQHPMAVRVDAPGASRSFNSAAAGFGARRAGEDARLRAHALTVAQHDPGAETVPAVRLQAPARAASHCPVRAHRARISCRRRVRHFLVGCEALRPFISLRMRKGSRVTVRGEATAALFPPDPSTRTGSKLTDWCRCPEDASVLWGGCLLRVSGGCLNKGTVRAAAGLVLQSRREKQQTAPLS